jgi:4-hydroxyproline epimerase
MMSFGLLMMTRIRVLDSHTGGEPTRLVISGGADLGSGPITERLETFRTRHDRFRSAVVNEPRGADAIVGALLLEPSDPACDLGVIFFNNVGYLNMCGHGTIGLCATLRQTGKLPLGPVKIETPVGVVNAVIHSDSEVTIRNVPSYRHLADVALEVPGAGIVRGDVAWGGNWFFLVKGESPIPLHLRHLEELTHRTWRIREALRANGITGAGGAEIDHIELFGPPQNPRAHSRNFVLCPGKSYDRSPCGTGTSAKMACLYADGLLKPGQTYIQESICGSLFEGAVEIAGDSIIPSIKGEAFVTAETELILNPNDPFCWGIPNHI